MLHHCEWQRERRRETFEDVLQCGGSTSRSANDAHLALTQVQCRNCRSRTSNRRSGLPASRPPGAQPIYQLATQTVEIHQIDGSLVDEIRGTKCQRLQRRRSDLTSMSRKADDMDSGSP